MNTEIKSTTIYNTFRCVRYFNIIMSLTTCVGNTVHNTLQYIGSTVHNIILYSIYWISRKLFVKMFQILYISIIYERLVLLASPCVLQCNIVDQFGSLFLEWFDLQFKHEGNLWREKSDYTRVQVFALKTISTSTYQIFCVRFCQKTIKQFVFGLMVRPAI